MSQPILKLLEQTLDYTTFKQKLISKNIANISSKDYEREDVKFDDFLSMEGKGQLKATENKHFTTGEVKLPGQSNFKITRDNNVDMDTEMADMAQNSILFRLAARRMNFYFSQLQTVIKGGR